MSTELLSIRLRFEHDVVIARQRAREAAALLGFRDQEQIRLATVVSELARRAYRAGEGRVEFFLEGSGADGRLDVRVRHPVPEDESVYGRALDEVLTGARRLLDHVEARSERGTVEVTVGQRLPGFAPRLDDGELEEALRELREKDPTNPFEELQRQNEELVEAMAALREQERERTRLLEAERRAREEAQRAVKGREEILSIVSHDLRNPIGAIQTGARFLLDQPEVTGEGVGRRQLRAIVRSAERANRLIQDLLDLSSIDQNTLSVRTAREEVGAILDEVREVMAGKAGEADLRLEVDVRGSPPPVCADLDRVVQALGNLVSNAIRYTPRGGAVGVEAAGDPGSDAVRFTVWDTGPGIPEEDREHLFDRFWTKGDPSAGAGLGLAIVRGIVEGHGGRVWLDPEAGEGAVFRFTIPVAGESGREEEGPCGG